MATCGQGWCISARSSARGLVAAEAAELTAVADGAGGFVEVQLAGSMVVEEAGNVARGLQGCIFGVALFAAERRVDLGVTDQAIGHLGHCSGGRLDGFG